MAFRWSKPLRLLILAPLCFGGALGAMLAMLRLWLAVPTWGILGIAAVMIPACWAFAMVTADCLTGFIEWLARGGRRDSA